ncbi:envelope stress response membrane protein PspB [Glaciecola sp. XM2]|jgi:phage shock protein B|uniref:envelope stress response membrane protein PspB n=1 Tax=Glaciecola sp. XM2 TaxID=1914931 RepID=UPI001BDF2C92|nr:envelope stress response membrane protein PspB [Glaciecola sp. XM2]MBT1450873.1 envelope stress response membrane protein PspB [Glaciecola sp. XM2]
MAEIFVILTGTSLIVFTMFVAPIWLILHYRSKKQVSQGLSESEVHTLQSLAEKEEQMSERIKTLEAILDSEAPNWRERA